MQNLDIFIKGELIDLCVPTKEFAANSDWYKLFNNSKITRFLEQGAFTNSAAEQEEFFLSQRGNRLILIIMTKKQEFKGVISLSFLDFSKKACDIALVTDYSVNPELSRYSNLEAMALITEHGFKNMGMLRISAGQHIALGNWQQRLELIGYKLEGLHEKKFKKAHESSDSMSICCSYTDYLRLSESRGGNLWDDMENMKKRIENLPEKSFKDEFSEFFQSQRNKYYDDIFTL